MSNIKKSSILLIFIICIQFIVYIFFLKPVILTWGATENEANMELAGDSIAPFISATRAISINTPDSHVWKWIIQLGADRGGFFSYTFIEESLGYDSRFENNSLPKFQEMRVGRVVPGSTDPSSSVIKYSWPVVSVESGKYYVLKGWGTFYLKKISPKKTRFIVRTHGRESKNLMDVVDNFFGIPMHYIMERRMMMGFKARAEGVQLSTTADLLWFLGILLSFIGIVVLIFTGRSIQSMTLSVFFGITWLWPLLIFDPQPIYSIILLLSVLTALFWFFYKKSHNKEI